MRLVAAALTLLLFALVAMAGRSFGTPAEVSHAVPTAVTMTMAAAAPVFAGPAVSVQAPQAGRASCPALPGTSVATAADRVSSDAGSCPASGSAVADLDFDDRSEAVLSARLALAPPALLHALAEPPALPVPRPWLGGLLRPPRLLHG